jgi:hypothetical protein
MKALLMDSIPAIASLVDGEALPELQEVKYCPQHITHMCISQYKLHALYIQISPLSFK